MRPIPKLLLVFVTLSIGVAAQTLTTFTVNPEASTLATGINDNGDVVGYYGCSSQTCACASPRGCGFLRSGSTGKFKHLGPQVIPEAVNDSDEYVGIFNRNPAFYSLSTGGLVKYLRGDQPTAVAVNTAGYVAGSFCVSLSCPAYPAYLMTPAGQMATIFAPTNGYTWAAGLNNSNQVVGYWYVPGVTQHQGFVYTNGTVNSAFNYPGAVATSPTAINDSGEIVGTWTDSVGFVHGFYWTPKLGFTSFDVPKTTHTIPVAVNASGVIAGYYAIRQDTAYAAFMCSADGVVTTITVPHAQTLQVTGINAQGTIVGTYDSGKEDRGFLYQP
jgi:hypothetical protein